MPDYRGAGWWAAAMVACWALAGCVEPSPDDGDGEAADGMARGDARLGDGPDPVGDGATGDAIVDLGRVEGDAGGDAAADMGGMSDALTDGELPRPDAQSPGPVETCEQVCDRYVECGVDDRFGGIDGCLEDCARLSRGGRPDAWFDCVEIEQCNLLRRCPVPEIEALSCDDVCGLVGECGVALALPDCGATCAENAEQFRPCGEVLYGGRCDGAAFTDCVVEQVFPACRALCDAGVGCNLVREDECIADCLDDRLSGDALGGLRSQQLAQCTSVAAGDCERLDACFFPVIEGGPAVDRAGFCNDYRACGLGEFYTCDDMLLELGDEGIACAQALLDDNCPAFDPFLEFDLVDFCAFGAGVDPRQAPCQRLCEAQEVCGLLPAGVQRFECINGCTGVAGADPDEQARADATLACGGVDRCAELVMCIEGSGPGVECAALCASLDGCGLGGDGCAAGCDAVWPRDRHEAYRACVAAAGDDCRAVGACRLAPAPPCDAVCARIGECGSEVVGCEGACDDAHFVDPAGVIAEVACILTAPVCSAPEGHSVDGCLAGSVEGVQCLGYCRATTECAGNAAGLADCLVACGAGLVGDEGLRFSAAEACLAGLAPDAGCDAVSRCVPDGAEPDCALVCDRASGCGIALAECPVRCLEDPLARLRSLRGGACILPGDDCGTVAACILPPPFVPGEVAVEPGIDEGSWCAAFDGCPDAPLFFGECGPEFEFIRDELGEDGLRCTRQALDACGDEWFNDYDDCFFGAGPAPLANPLEAPCAVLCEAQRYCDPAGPAQRECEVACAAQLDRADPESAIRLAPQMSCGGAWSCDDLDACLAVASPAQICAAQCADRLACGLVVDGGDCAATCLRDFGRAREVGRRACLATTDGCDAIAACEPAPPLPCGLACDALAACGLAPDRCVPACDDAGYRDAAGAAQRIACLVAAGDDCAAVGACEVDPGQGGGACFAYCRATTECAGPGGDLPGCLTRCLTGFGDDEALRFAAAEGCLADAAGAGCEVLLACLPAEAAVDCEGYCGAIDACAVPAADCRAACAAAPDREAAICVSDARRTGAGCGGVAACVGYVPPVADAECRALCEIASGCDRTVDAYLCRLGCTPAPAALPFQLACAELSSCGVGVDACLALDDTVAAGCRDLCTPAVVDGCGLFADADACAAECSGRDAAERTPPGYVGLVAECLDGATPGGRCDAEAASLCFEPGSCDLRDDLIFFGGNAGEVDVDIEPLADAYEGSCGESAGPEAIIVVSVAVPSTLTAQISDANYDTLLYLRSACDGEELACNDDSFEIDLPDGLWSSIVIDVEPGLYYLFVEGFLGEVGQASVRIDVVPN